MTSLDRQKILEFIPHRDPFIFIDSVKLADEINISRDEIGCTVEGNYFVSENLECLKGHFPGNPILPGVIQTEMMAQTACFTLYSFCGENVKSIQKLAMVGIDHVRFRLPVTPNMFLNTRATLIKKRGSIRVHDCAIFYQGDLVSEAQIMSTIEFI